MIQLFILVLVSISYFATDVYLPSLPSIGEAFSASETTVQLTLFSYLISFSSVPLIFGPLSDHIGRRRVIRMGLMIALVATVACIFSPTIEFLMIGRFFQGVGTGAVMIATRSMIPDLFTGKDLARQISNFTMMMPLVLACAPTVGGLLQEVYGWQSVFVFLSCYIAIIAICTTFFEESIKTRHKKTFFQVIAACKEFILNREFVLYGMGMVLPAIGVFAYLTASPFLFQEGLGLTPAAYGVLAFYVGGSIILSGFINSRLISFVSVNKLIFIGIGAVFTSGILLFCFHFLGIYTVWSVLGPTMLYFTCLPLTSSNSIAKALEKVTHSFGLANALLTTFQIFAGAMGSLVISFVPDITPVPLAVCFLLVGAALTITSTLACKGDKS
jgi:Bcr/CflA subfamily drug resistance transporter